MMRDVLAHEIVREVRKGRSPKEIVDVYLARFERLEPKLHAFLSLNPRLWEEVEGLERRLAAGEELPLAGVPIAVKDNLLTEGLATTCASKILEGYIPPYSATSVVRFQRAGGILLGKTNLDEFAMGSSTETSAFGPTLNPWDLSRVPGGSSGGSAVAVAADLAPLALGSDTGGSVRQPAAFCGIYGFKPTYGRVSRYGLVAFASSLDQVGGMARSLEDLALLMDVIAGPDPRDGTSLDLPPRFQAALHDPPPRRIGLVEETLEGNTRGIQEALAQAEELLTQRGVHVQRVRVPMLSYALETYYLLATSEASSNLARYDGTLFGLRQGEGNYWESAAQSRALGFGREVKRRILSGTFALSSGYHEAYYGQAWRARRQLQNELAEVFQEVEALLLPTTPTPAFPLGSKRDPLELYRSDVDTVAANLAGLPALSVPVGMEEGLPIGLQLMGPPQRDERLFALARVFEELSALFHHGAPL